MRLLKPHQFNAACFVAQSPRQAFYTPFARHFESPQNAFKLHGVAVFVEVSDVVKFSFINISKWKMIQQIAESKYPQFEFQ